MNSFDNSGISHNEDGSLSILLDLAVYTDTSIKKASYKFAADCSILLLTHASNQMKAILSFSENTGLETKKTIARALCNEIIDQDLREKIAKETEATRNLILAQAFSQTSLLTQE
jgi:His-Xaa-Ser system protein HxsD